MQAQQAGQRHHHVDAALAAADHAAGEREAAEHDQGHQGQQDPRRPGAGACQLVLQADALPEQAGAFDDPSAAVGAQRHRLAHRLRIVERAGLLDQLHGLGDRRILKRKGERSGVQRLPSREQERGIMPGQVGRRP